MMINGLSVVNPNKTFHDSTKTHEMTKSKPIKAYLERDLQVVLASLYPPFVIKSNLIGYIYICFIQYRLFQTGFTVINRKITESMMQTSSNIRQILQ